MRWLVAVALSVLISACAHNLTLVPRDGGAAGRGHASATMADTGQLTIDLDGETYSGRWVFVRSGGQVGTLLASNAGGTTFGTFSGVPTGGIGTALLNSPSGKALRCEFQYNEWGGTGIGVCQRNGTGEMYDLQIH